MPGVLPRLPCIFWRIARLSQFENGQGHVASMLGGDGTICNDHTPLMEWRDSRQSGILCPDFWRRAAHFSCCRTIKWGQIGMLSCTHLIRIAAKTAIAIFATVVLPGGADAQEKTPVSIELVLAIDTSYSVDGFEYDLLMKGIANAFRTPEIIEIIGQKDGVAVTLFQWSSEVNEQNMIPWHLLKDPLSVLSFAKKVENVERDPKRRFTGIGGAIDYGVRLISENAFEGRHLKIDVSGDGRNNFYPPPTVPRQQAIDLGIVINGLPIITHADNYSYDLETYYREEVIHGPGAFIEIADDYNDFARAFHRKLRRELSQFFSHENTAPHGLTRKAHLRPVNDRL